MNNALEIAVLLPCYNEAITIAQVVHDFQQALPQCTVYVYDNNSTDETLANAAAAGAITRSEPQKGKGNVVRRMFADIEADVYLLADGDGTYDISAASQLVGKLIHEQLDMVVGTRVAPPEEQAAYRLGHRLGNKLFTKIISLFFHSKFTDVFSGYRAFSRRFVKSFPADSQQFEIETEITIHSLELRVPTAEIPTKYISRPEGSHSKLNSYRDGFLILMRIALLLKEIRPMFFFGCIFLLLSIMSIVLFFPVFMTYLHTGLVPRLPTAVLSTGTMLLAFVSLGCGIILDNVSRGRKAVKRFFYLSLPHLSRNTKSTSTERQTV